MEGVAEDKGNPRSLTEVGEPVPVEHALDGRRGILSVGSDELEELLRAGSEALVGTDFYCLVQDTDA